MKRLISSEEHIAYALCRAQLGTPVVNVCRQIGASAATYYTRKKKFGDLGERDFKRIVADLSLDQQNVPAVAAAAIGLVSKERDERAKRAASSKQGDCDEPSSIWVIAHAGLLKREG